MTATRRPSRTMLLLASRVLNDARRFHAYPAYCATCGQPMVASDRRLYCCDYCRVKAYRQRKRAII